MHKKQKLNDFQIDFNDYKKYAKEYSASKPYKHCILTDLFNQELLQKVRQEILQLHFTEKETDIYKVNQTGDLANLDGLDAIETRTLENLVTLRNNLYSREFRDFIQNVLQCGPIGDSIDLSVNKYTKGCHLLNHDDVIGTRLVSYILYLPDPSAPWLPEYGGQLELYPVETKGTPKNEPTKIIQPNFNTMVFFDVQPGHSFHSVEEVVADKQRISVSGWFHHPLPGEKNYKKPLEEQETSKSTLEQILTTVSQDFKEYSQEFKEELTADDILYLKMFLNPQYLVKKTVDQANAKFCEESHIELGKILHPSIEKLLESLVKDTDMAQVKEGSMTPHYTGVDGKWITRGPAHLQRYLVLDHSLSASDKVITECNVLEKLRELFGSDSFRRWLGLICSLKVEKYRSQVRRFRPGLDYTLALSNQFPLLHLNLLLTPDHDLWETGDVGGYSSYLLPHNDQNAAVYDRTSDEGILLTSAAAWNRLDIVVRDEGILHFVKYVSANAPSSRWDIDCEYLIDLA